MLNQLFRQEAIDAYTERWLGEVSVPSLIPPAWLATIAITSLTSLLALLIFGSYTRHIIAEGTITGSLNEEIVIPDFQARHLRVGHTVALAPQGIQITGGPFSARVNAIAQSSDPGGPVRRIRLGIPPALDSATGMRFHVRIPVERRRVYEWMFPCCVN